MATGRPVLGSAATGNIDVEAAAASDGDPPTRGRRRAC
jgi:hypothetical protein